MLKNLLIFLWFQYSFICNNQFNEWIKCENVKPFQERIEIPLFDGENKKCPRRGGFCVEHIQTLIEVLGKFDLYFPPGSA